MTHSLLPLTANKQSQLFNQLHQQLEIDKKEFQDRIEVLELKKPLLSHIKISVVNGFLLPFLDSDLPDWLVSFLEETYQKVHNKLASDNQ